MGRVYDALAYYDESYRRAMRAIKEAEQLTPKEYGMRIKRNKKKKKRK